MTETTHPCAALLNQLIEERNNPSHRELAKLSAEAGHPLSIGTISALRNGKTPDLDTGRKLSSFFCRPITDFMPELSDLATSAPADPKFGRLPLSRLRLSPINERKSFDTTALDEMVEDIAERGILQNLNVYPDTEIEGDWLVAAGGRRWRSCKKLETQHRLPADLLQYGVPVRFCKDEAEALVITVVENLHREDPHFLDRAGSYARLRDDLGWNSDQIAATVHKHRDHVTQYLRVHDRLTPEDKDRAFAGELNFTQARELVAEKGTRGIQEKGGEGYDLEAEPPLPLVHIAEGPETQASIESALPSFSVNDAQREAVGTLQGLLDNPPQQRQTERPISERLKDLCCRYGEFKRGELNAGSDVNFAAIVDDINAEFGTTISRDEARGVTSLGAMARFIIGRMSAPQASARSTYAETRKPITATIRSGHPAIRWNLKTTFPEGGHGCPVELVLINIDTGDEVFFIPAQSDIEGGERGSSPVAAE